MKSWADTKETLAARRAMHSFIYEFCRAQTPMTTSYINKRLEHEPRRQLPQSLVTALTEVLFSISAITEKYECNQVLAILNSHSGTCE